MDRTSLPFPSNTISIIERCRGCVRAQNGLCYSHSATVWDASGFSLGPSVVMATPAVQSLYWQGAQLACPPAFLFAANAANRIVSRYRPVSFSKQTPLGLVDGLWLYFCEMCFLFFLLLMESLVGPIVCSSSASSIYQLSRNPQSQTWAV